MQLRLVTIDTDLLLKIGRFEQKGMRVTFGLPSSTVGKNLVCGQLFDNLDRMTRYGERMEDTRRTDSSDSREEICNEG